MQEYIAKSKESKEILNSAKLLQSVELNALIYGEKGVGKKSLAKFILPKAKIYQARILQEEVAHNIHSFENENIVIDKIEDITNIDLITDWLNKSNVRVIATTLKKDLNPKLEDLFSITIEIPNLKQREEDLDLFISKFSKEAAKNLNIQEIPISKLMINLANNTHSLRKSIYFSYLFQSVDENEILMLMERYIHKNLKSDNLYKEFLYLYEVPLLNVAKKEYKSQVQMAKNLGLNRVTLRKKIDIHKDLLND